MEHLAVSQLADDEPTASVDQLPSVIAFHNNDARMRAHSPAANPCPINSPAGFRVIPKTSILSGTTLVAEALFVALLMPEILWFSITQ
jgi:hypothetical protein